MAETKRLKYIDHKKLWFPSLFFYRGGIGLPGGDNIIKVTEQEAISLLSRKNGSNFCFEEIKAKAKTVIDEKPEIKEEL